jgi:hypothetical protein
VTEPATERPCRPKQMSMSNDNFSRLSPSLPTRTGLLGAEHAS